MIRSMSAVRRQIKETMPLIHCITNPISIHDCANAILAAGARPIMAEHPKEAAQITASAQALVVNLGNITDARMESAGISMRTAREEGIPSLLDLVGVACSGLRYTLARELLRDMPPAILKGNITELLKMTEEPDVSGIGQEKGVGIDARRQDALSDANCFETIRKFAALSERTGSVILATGRQDLIVSADQAYLASNGVDMLSRITGTGCMAGALCGVYLAGGDPLTAAVLGVSVLNIAGELAQESAKGPGSFQINLQDEMYGLTDSILQDRLKLTAVDGI